MGGRGSFGGRAFFAGAGSVIALLALAMAHLRLVPEDTPLSDVARLFDSLAPWFLGLALVAGLGVLALRLGGVGSFLVLASVAAGAHLWVDHRATSLPRISDRPADLRVLFFNIYSENGAYADRIVTAVFEAAPDIVVFAEGEGLYPALARLSERYQIQSPCTFEACDLLVATKRPPQRFWSLSLNAAWPNRYAVTEMTTQSGKPVFVAASHSVKPWLSGLAESEQVRLAAQYDWLSGPVVAVGDFNAAPWGYSVQKVLRASGMRALRRPVPSWPARAGGLGVPIDHVLVKGGARVVAAAPFGGQLNSNHRGLLVDIALP